MKITLEFDSLDDLYDQLDRFLGWSREMGTKQPKSKAVPFTEAVDHAELNATTKRTTEIINKAEKKIEEEEKTEAEEAPANVANVANVPEVNEDFRVEVRRVLAELNSIAKQNGGGKPAQELIKGMGFQRLTDVPLDKLPELMTKAKEALDGAAQ